MLIDFENTGYITVCETPEIVPVEEKNSYIPASTWGFIRGDIKEQSDLISLLTTIESGLTPEQIKLLVDTDSRFEDVEKSVIELDAKNTNEYVEINLILDTKADAADVYSKLEIDNKGYLTEHQSLADYYTKREIDTALDNLEVDLSGYATEEWVKQQGYLTEHQSLVGYATESYVDTAVESKIDINSIWTGTQAQWDALTTEQQNSYIIAMIEV